MRKLGRLCLASALLAAPLGAGVAVAQAPEGMPQDQSSCEAAGYIWVQDPDGRDQMVCLYVDESNGPIVRGANGSDSGGPAPAAPSVGQPVFTG